MEHVAIIEMTPKKSVLGRDKVATPAIRQEFLLHTFGDIFRRRIMPFLKDHLHIICSM
jgi:hypothetical protein